MSLIAQRLEFPSILAARRRCPSRSGVDGFRQQGQPLLGGQNGVREARSIDLVRRVHAFLLEGSGRILDQGDVVAKLPSAIIDSSSSVIGASCPCAQENESHDANRQVRAGQRTEEKPTRRRRARPARLRTED